MRWWTCTRSAWLRAPTRPAGRTWKSCAAPTGPLVQTATGFLREAVAALERHYAGLPQPSPQALERVKEGLCRELLGEN